MRVWCELGAACPRRDAAGCAVRLLASALAGSFDSADLDEEDPDEGVGVDERAALLQPEDFFLDDEDWYASARWLMERPETEDCITAALLTHMAPLYVPYADVRARSPKEVVPSDVQVGSLRSIRPTVTIAAVLEPAHTHLHAQRAGGVCRPCSTPTRSDTHAPAPCLCTMPADCSARCGALPWTSWPRQTCAPSP